VNAEIARTNAAVAYLDGNGIASPAVPIAVGREDGVGLPAIPADRHGLSTDYLNHYSEILMLIEMVSFDASIGDEIGRWQPIGYREYFGKSPLRRAPAAIAAYDALAAESRLSFEQIVQALDKLTVAAIVALRPPCHPHNVTLIGEVIGPAIRRLIDGAAAFLNSGGNGLWEGCEADHAQRATDLLIARSA
jgi:hypothetical protein